jgi:hypothetical protein
MKILVATLALLGLVMTAPASVIWDLTPFTGSAIGVNILVENDVAPNTLKITATVTPDGGNTLGDLRGIFFDIDGGAADVTADMFSGVGLTKVCLGTGIIKCGGGDDNLNGSSPIEAGSFNVGLEIGTSGIGQGDDFPTAVILLNYGALGLTPERLGPFGARVTSVGTATNRGGSAKLYGDVPTIPDTETQVPEPSTLLMLGAGLGLVTLAKVRRQRS